MRAPHKSRRLLAAPALAFALLLTFAPLAGAQARSDTTPAAIVIRAGYLIDGKGDTRRAGPFGVLVQDSRIAFIGSPADAATRAPAGTTTLDLGDATLLPGLIDAHTHVLLQGDITTADYDVQLLKESIPYRTIRATAAVRSALMQGFTTIRDVETEGAMYADVDLKTAIDRGIIPGPRMFVATRALAPTGMYPLLGYSWELDMPHGVQVVDGVDAARRAVREQVRFGADWIKFYADRRYYVAPDGRLRSMVNFTDDEAKAIVDEAHRLGKKVAAHAVGWDGIDAALRAGVNSIEHGQGLTDDLMDRMIRQGVYWCPTLYVLVYVAPGRGGIWPRLVEFHKRSLARAVQKGVLIANGSDAGGYAWTEPLARELELLVQYGMTPMQAIKAATSVAARLLEQEDRLGVLEPGKLADIIAVRGNPLSAIGELERVIFVMKDGTVYRQQ